MNDHALVMVEHAIDRATDELFRRQRADGSWQDHLPSSAVSTGTALVALATADREGNAELLAQGAQWLRATQRADGGWGDALVDPGNLNGTAIAIAALAYVDPAASQAAMARGMAFIEANGGMPAVEDRARCSLSVICRTLMAQAGLYPWEKVVRIPLELILLPNGLKQKVSFTLPGAFAWGLMQAHTRPAGPLRRLINRIAEPRFWPHTRGRGARHR
jgi:squalene-hopene/tetraprenyl-beta-curcumene cyclase